MKKVILITGSPGSGKSTYARKHAGPNDIVFDLDEVIKALGGGPHDTDPKSLSIALAMRDAAITEIAKRTGSWENAYFITSSANRDNIQRLCKQLQAEEIALETSLDDCISNIMQDQTRPDKERSIALAKEWHNQAKAEAKPKTARDLFSEWFSDNWT